jgi:PAS domain S-box-containing protein
MSGSEDLEGYLDAEIRAGLSTPLLSRSGDLLGMVSAYWREPHELSESELRTLDILARLAADLIERSLAEDRLSESEKHLKNAERLAHVGHWQWDLRSNRVSGSEEMYRIFGKPPDYVPSYDDILPADRERVQRLIERSLATKVPHSVEFQIAHPNGDLRTIFCTWEVLVDEEALPVRIFGTCQDITDSRRAREESFARQKLESVGTLASGIAHDFNNLLGGILAQAELALAEVAAGSHPEAELHRIRDVAMQGAEIVRQLMIYAGKESDAVELVDISRIVGGMLDLLSVSVSKHAALETDLDKDLTPIKANAAQLRQIVMNLVINASEAMHNQDGLIRVTTAQLSLERDAAISRGVPEGDYLLLEVSDSGHGIALEQARVFDPFFTTKSTGHGLGLAVVHGIVRNLHGAIDIESEVGKGTTVRVLLPAATESGAGVIAAPAAPDAACGEHALSVLVVEDEYPLRQAIAKMLRKTGFEVREATNGSAAIDLLRANDSKLDAILLDMTIPGKSSQEVLAEAAQALPDVKVILTSAYSEETVTANVNAPVVRSFIRKPFQLEDLVKTLRNTLAS